MDSSYYCTHYILIYIMTPGYIPGCLFSYKNPQVTFNKEVYNVMSIINYNDWFYKYHAYISGTRDGLIGYNDNKWKTINDRLLPLINSGSDLISDQPFMVVGNNYGFDRLLNMMQDSNYTYDDVDNALIETYKFNYKNAMSRMLVNTHAVICTFSNRDKEHVTYDSVSKYYVVDVPYDQMHFGERDEFIRQRLQKMHVKSTNVWIDIKDLNTIPIYSEILEFGIMITMNGLICNDCKVAFDDKGMMFKVRWRKSTNFECIVYKLDMSKVYSFDIDTKQLNGADIVIPWSATGYEGMIDDSKLNCIVDIYFNEFISTMNVAGNFGYIDKAGIHIPNIQDYTARMLFTNKALSKVHVTVYELKYFFEVPNIYPAMNYNNMLNKNLIKYKGDTVVDNEGNRVYTTSDVVDYTVDVCTPPICIDRDTSSDHRVLLYTTYYEEQMKSFTDSMIRIGAELRNVNDNSSDAYIEIAIGKPIENIYAIAKAARENYLKFASLTSMVEQSNINRFDRILKDVELVYRYRNTKSILKNVRPDMFYGSMYKVYVDSIYEVLQNKMFASVNLFNKITNNFISNSSIADRITRPVSEQCFITLKYDKDEDVWLFVTPKIRHFNGIENAFYIKQNLDGDEIFKFFVLYTDTEATGEKYITPLTKDQVFDFDVFCDEISRHQAYIRYWTVENKLMKMSDVMFNRYDGSTCVALMSKMLKHRIGDDLLKEYPSDINYELSGVTTLGEANEDKLVAPFTINHLFYTLQLFYNQNDTFLSYFLYRLTHDNFAERYIDINVASVLNKTDTDAVNYSYFVTAPNINTSASIIKSGINVYDGLPFVMNGPTVTNTPYRYVFNVYDDTTIHPLMYDNNIDKDYYLMHQDTDISGMEKHIYHNDIEVCRLLALYLCTLRENMSTLMTDYQISFNQRKQMLIFREEIERDAARFKAYLDPDVEFANPQLRTFIEGLFGSAMEFLNNVYKNLYDCLAALHELTDKVEYNGRNMTIYMFIEDFISTIKMIHLNYGFKDMAVPRARKLYMHLKKINGQLNLYEFEQWFNQIDIEFIRNITDYVANNSVYPGVNFSGYIATFNKLVDDVPGLISTLRTLNIGLVNRYNGQSSLIEGYCWTAINTYIFDMYRINIDFEPTAVTGIPKYATITLPTSAHTTHPVTGVEAGNVDLVFYPKYELNAGNEYTVLSLVPTAEYVFFDDTPIDNVDVSVVTESGTSLVVANLTFSRVSSSADILDTIHILNNLKETKVDIQNVHETANVSNNLIVNHKFGDMHYELLIGDRFDQLSHVSELTLDRETMLPGSIDRIYVPNQTINDYSLDAFGGHVSNNIYFKPSQVMHIDIDDNVISSVYGAFTVGQTIYLENAEEDYVFPVKITTIDHSLNRGFLEAVVDEDAKWFKLTDKTRIHDYLNNEIECHVVPDNVSNFLNEYNNINLKSYDIVDLYEIPYEEMYSFPGDPIFVQNNANYVYTRINWFIGDNIDNRFIDDEHKQYQFKYLGEYQIYETDVPMMPVRGNVDHYYDSLRYLEPESWFDIEHNKPLKLMENSIGDEHELVHHADYVVGGGGVQNYNELTVGVNSRGSFENVTLYVVFKRTDFDGNDSPTAFPNNILSTMETVTTTYAQTPTFLIGCRNDVANLNKICFYGGAAPSPGDPGVFITSNVTADDYHVAAVTFESRDNSKYVSLYVDGTLAGTIEHNYDFMNILGINQTTSPTMDLVLGGGGTTHIKFIATATSVHTAEEIQDNSEWLYNRYCDDDTKVTHPIYDSFRVNMINHNVNPLTLSEMYPILRREPDDHDVWDTEIDTFKKRIIAAEHKIEDIKREIVTLEEEYARASTRYSKDRIYREIEECNLKLSYQEAYIIRVNEYIHNLETPSTWYNIGSYNAALVYVDNGRAECVTNSFIECITDIPYTDKLEFYMYDFQNHQWLKPNDYTVTINMVDGVKFDNPDDFTTNNVLQSIEIELLRACITNKLLLYIGFNKSDMFESIQFNPATCNVRFKPLISINRPEDLDIYNDINVRKHYDGYELYKYAEDNLPNDIDRADILEGFMVERPNANGKYTMNPVYRFKDIMINNQSYESFDFYVPLRFKDAKTNESSDINEYECAVNVPVDSYQTNTKMTLICVESDYFNGNASTLTFEAVSGDDDEHQSFNVVRSSTLHLDAGRYICTVLSSSSAYKSCGGLITIVVTKHENDELICGNWVKLNNPMYHIIPEKFIVSCPVEGQFPYRVEIKMNYHNMYDKTLYPDNSLPDDPYKYYYNTKKHIRYPISDTRHSNNNKRLAIDTNRNDNIEVIKSNYIGICRYSLDTIPENGFIDMTGHLPTPLTRDRYEFWVNGRCIRDTRSLHIISPTSIQLCNLTSLRNFECIELVDDVYDSDILPHGNVYIDLYGNYYHTGTYESFLQMMANNRYIIDQRIDYTFYNLQHDKLFDYTDHIVKDPNNHDSDPNILDGLVLSETTNYREFIHLPTINGVTLYNLSIKEFGLHELSTKEILDKYDNVWRHEAVTNPFVPLHHTSEILNIPVIKYDKDFENDCYRIKIAGQYDGFFTIYISTTDTDEISNTHTTKQIIPFVTCGTEIILEGISTYKKKYVCTTAYSQPKKLN